MSPGTPINAAARPDKPLLRAGRRGPQSRQEAEVHVRNPGLSLTGTPEFTVEGDFVMRPLCPTTIASGSQCVVKVSMAPIQAGPRSGRLVISASPGGTHMVTLSGQGLLPDAGADQ